MRYSHNLMAALTLAFLSLISCAGQSGTSAKDSDVQIVPSNVYVPLFNADSAYSYIKAQVDFGPRVMNSEAHERCAQYLQDKLRELGAEVTVQKADLSSYDGKIYKASNIVGSINPDLKKRVVLFSHWDSRPWADRDPDASKHYTPIDGANDGASGVGVLLELIRIMGQEAPTIGIDVIFLDAEDAGNHAEYKGQESETSWCLGSQYWGRNPHISGYNARYGILLDMVGGENTVFKYEYYSERYAKNINKKVWNAAGELGFGKYFKKEVGGGATDDHLFINEYARIPTIDIVASEPGTTFFKYWHTVKDNMDCISKETLHAVGQTLLQVLYNEK